MSTLYNLAGAMTSETYPSSHMVSYNYDQAGRLGDKVPQSQNPQDLAFSGNLGADPTLTYASALSYTAAGQPQEEKFSTATPVYHKRHYNVRGQLYDIRVATQSWQTGEWGYNRGAIINWYDSTSGFTYQNPNSGTDNNGNVLRSEVFIPNDDQISSYSLFRDNFTYEVRQTQTATETPRGSFNQQYDYDSLNRLQKVSDDRNSPTWRQQYSYDRWGNRTIDQSYTFNVGVPTWSFGVDTAANRLTAPSPWTMSYDAAGNLTTDTYTGAGDRVYDGENRMTKAWANNQWQTYTYDGDGHRVKRSVALGGQSPVETWQVYGIGGELLAEYDVNGSPSSPRKEYGYRNGQLLITATVTTGSGGSPYSFTDNPVVAGTTTIRALHLNELRTAVNQARAPDFQQPRGLRQSPPA